MVEIVANLHAHTPYSDGHAYHREIARAAARAGIQVVAVTDHNVLVGGKEGYVDGVLLLVGEEIHDARRRPQANHCLVFNAGQEMCLWATRPQRLIDEVNKRAGLSFLAHPFDEASPLDPELDAIPWLDWDVHGFTGIELWNYMSEFKTYVKNVPTALLAILLPSLFIRGPSKSTLRRWDALLAAGRRVAAIGNADAHGMPIQLGLLAKPVFDYAYLFRCVNTHLLIERPLSGDVDKDKQMVYRALREGRGFVAYDLAGAARGFSFTARSSAAQAGMGEALQRGGAVRFAVRCPRSGFITLLRNGQRVALGFGKALDYISSEPGAYRVEVRCFFRGWLRGWIYSNPIYVT
jgi:hypothetical protein